MYVWKSQEHGNEHCGFVPGRLCLCFHEHCVAWMSITSLTNLFLLIICKEQTNMAAPWGNQIQSKKKKKKTTISWSLLMETFAHVVCFQVSMHFCWGYCWVEVILVVVPGTVSEGCGVVELKLFWWWSRELCQRGVGLLSCSYFGGGPRHCVRGVWGRWVAVILVVVPGTVSEGCGVIELKLFWWWSQALCQRGVGSTSIKLSIFMYLITPTTFRSKQVWVLLFVKASRSCTVLSNPGLILCIVCNLHQVCLSSSTDPLLRFDFHLWRGSVQRLEYMYMSSS